MQVLHFILVGIHLTASAIWLGSMCYSLFVFQPRLRAHLNDPEKFEQIVQTVSAGMRRAVIVALTAIGGSGVTLLFWPGGTGWWVMNAAKLVLWLVACGLFSRVTLRLWPARVFATADELPGIQQQAARIGYTMFAVVSLAFVLGITATHLLD
ncbi:MAG: hypothetical protein AAGD32_17995 [Planctomycetota bacterium]